MHARPVRTLLPLLLLLAAFVVPAARAQAGFDVSVISAETGQAIDGVEVVVANEAIGFEARKTTGAQGKVRFEGLSTAGAYDVFAPESEDFREARAEDLSLRQGFVRSVTLILPPASYELDEVVVTAGERSVAQVNRTDAEVSSSLTERQLEDVPVEGRNFTQALRRLPNVTAATGFFTEAPIVSINGTNGLYTNYLIDGFDNNENFLGGPKFEVPTGFVKDITVLTSTYSAEFGRTGSGVFNVTTKSGGNEFEGEAFYLTRPGQPLDGDFGFANRDLSGNAVGNGFSRQQGGFSIGGPIVEDQTFFYVNFSHTTDFKDNLLRVPQLGLAETIEGRNNFTYGSAKIDHNWTGRFRSSLRANVSQVSIEQQGGGLEGGVTFPSAANTQERDAMLVALNNTYTGDRFIYEGNFQYSRFDWPFGQPRNPDSPQVTVLAPSEQPLAVLGHPGFRFNELENTFQVQQKLTYSLGNHTIKGGANLISSGFSLEGGGNPNGNYTVRLNENQVNALGERGTGANLGVRDLNDLPGSINVLNYGVELRPSTFGRRQDQIALYLEDQFDVTADLTVTAGLRYDYDSLTKMGSDTGDLNNLGPRLGLNYALGERNTLRGGYGLVYDKIVYSIISDALERNSTAEGFRDQLRQLVDRGILPEDTDIDRITFDGPLTANASDVEYLEGPTPQELQGQREDIFSNARRILNPNGYDNPQTHQFSLGYQRQLGTDMLFYVDLIHTRSFNLPRLTDLNAPAPFDITREQVEEAIADPNRDPADLVRTVEEADATRPVAPAPGGARQINVTETAGEARYYAANLNLVKERAEGDPLAYRLSYTLSSLRNNTDDINFRAETGDDFSDEWGPSINDRTHVINGQVSYFPEAVPGLGVTVAGILQSGQPINRIPDATLFGTTDLNGDGREFETQYTGNSDRAPGASRNSDRLPWSSVFDVGVQYDLRAFGQTVELSADIFNVFNTENLSGFANNATQSNQIQVGPASTGTFVQRNAGPPRQFQFGARYLF